MQKRGRILLSTQCGGSILCKIVDIVKVANYGAYSDTGCHLHFHLVPKYRDEFEWGGVFAMNPGQVYLSEEEYAEMIEKIKANL